MKRLVEQIYFYIKVNKVLISTYIPNDPKLVKFTIKLTVINVCKVNRNNVKLAAGKKHWKFNKEKL